MINVFKKRKISLRHFIISIPKQISEVISEISLKLLKNTKIKQGKDENIATFQYDALLKHCNKDMVKHNSLIVNRGV